MQPIIRESIFVIGVDQLFENIQARDILLLANVSCNIEVFFQVCLGEVLVCTSDGVCMLFIDRMADHDEYRAKGQRLPDQFHQVFRILINRRFAWRIVRSDAPGVVARRAEDDQIRLSERPSSAGRGCTRID